MFTQGTCKFELFFHIPYTDGDALHRVLPDALLNETPVRIFFHTVYIYVVSIPCGLRECGVLSYMFSRNTYRIHSGQMTKDA